MKLFQRQSQRERDSGVKGRRRSSRGGILTPPGSPARGVVVAGEPPLVKPGSLARRESLGTKIMAATAKLFHTDVDDASVVLLVGNAARAAASLQRMGPEDGAAGEARIDEIMNGIDARTHALTARLLALLPQASRLLKGDACPSTDTMLKVYVLFAAYVTDAAKTHEESGRLLDEQQQLQVDVQTQPQLRAAMQANTSQLALQALQRLIPLLRALASPKISAVLFEPGLFAFITGNDSTAMLTLMGYPTAGDDLTVLSSILQLEDEGGGGAAVDNDEQLHSQLQTLVRGNALEGVGHRLFVVIFSPVEHLSAGTGMLGGLGVSILEWHGEVKPNLLPPLFAKLAVPKRVFIASDVGEQMAEMYNAFGASQLFLAVGLFVTYVPQLYNKKSLVKKAALEEISQGAVTWRQLKDVFVGLTTTEGPLMNSLSPGERALQKERVPFFSRMLQRIGACVNAHHVLPDLVEELEMAQSASEPEEDTAAPLDVPVVAAAATHTTEIFATVSS